MRRGKVYLLVCLVVSLLCAAGTALFAFLPTGGSSGSICATAKLSLDGPMPSSRSLAFDNVQQSSTGLFTRQTFEPYPPTLEASLCGSQRFTFTYSPNITDVKIFVAGEELYKGPPIGFLDASSKPEGAIRIQFTWSGQGVQIGISNG